MTPFAPGRPGSGHITDPGWEHARLALATEALEPQTRFADRWHPCAVDTRTDDPAEPMTPVEFLLEPRDGGTLLAGVESGFDLPPPGRRCEAFRMNERGGAEQLVRRSRTTGSDFRAVGRCPRTPARVRRGRGDIMSSENDLQRFVDAQESQIAGAMAELRGGRKRTHWMWFVFPQLRGLGQSQMAWHFGLQSREEAVAYLAHPVLGPRLTECVDLALAVLGKTAREIFGTPDDLKFLSCLTLFAEAERGKGSGAFDRALRQYFGGQPDQATLELLARSR